MSATASNYVYMVEVKKGQKKLEPSISKETLAEYRKNVEKYLVKKDDRGTH